MFNEYLKASKKKLVIKFIIGKILFSVFLGTCYYSYHKSLKIRNLIEKDTKLILDKIKR